MNPLTFIKILFLLIISTTFVIGCGNDTDDTHSPSSNDTDTDDNNNGKASEGKACTAPDACDTGLACIANQGSTTEGTCKTFVPCTSGAACASQTTNTHCGVAQGIGETIKLCTVPPAKITKGEPCSAPDACETGLACVANPGSTTEGTCQPSTPCTSMEECAGEPDKACIYVQGISTKIQRCGKQKDNLGGDIQESDDCTHVSDCVKGNICINKLGRTTIGTCTPAVVCESDKDCSSLAETPKCIEVKGVDGTANICGKPYCDADHRCPATQVCMLARDDFSKGHCVATCTDDTDCASDPDGKTSCTDLEVNQASMKDFRTSFNSKTCLNPNEKILGSECSDTDPCKDGYICGTITTDPGNPASTTKNACLLPCENEGFGKACGGIVNYCANVTNAITQEQDKVCIPIFFVEQSDPSKTVLKGDEIETKPCNETQVCPPSLFFLPLLCVKENPKDVEGKCLIHRPVGFPDCKDIDAGITFTVKKERIMNEKVADDTLEVCSGIPKP